MDKEEDMERIKLTASDGMWLTNGGACGKIVYLGVNDAPENWYEITEEEYQRVQLEAENDER